MTNNTKELVWVVVNGFELALLPGENVAEAVAEAEAVLDEQWSKPGLGMEMDGDWTPWAADDEAGDLVLGDWVCSTCCAEFDSKQAYVMHLSEHYPPIEVELGEADFMGATLAQLRLGLVKPFPVMSDDDDVIGEYEFTHRGDW